MYGNIDNECYCITHARVILVLYCDSWSFSSNFEFYCLLLLWRWCQWGGGRGTKSTYTIFICESDSTDNDMQTIIAKFSDLRLFFELSLNMQWKFIVVKQTKPLCDLALYTTIHCAGFLTVQFFMSKFSHGFSLPIQDSRNIKRTNFPSVWIRTNNIMILYCKE